MLSTLLSIKVERRSGLIARHWTNMSRTKQTQKVSNKHTKHCFLWKKMIGDCGGWWLLAFVGAHGFAAQHRDAYSQCWRDSRPNYQQVRDKVRYAATKHAINTKKTDNSSNSVCHAVIGKPVERINPKDRRNEIEKKFRIRYTSVLVIEMKTYFRPKASRLEGHRVWVLE